MVLLHLWTVVIGPKLTDWVGCSSIGGFQTLQLLIDSLQINLQGPICVGNEQLEPCQFTTTVQARVSAASNGCRQQALQLQSVSHQCILHFEGNVKVCS